MPRMAFDTRRPVLRHGTVFRSLHRHGLKEQAPTKHIVLTECANRRRSDENGMLGPLRCSTNATTIAHGSPDYRPDSLGIGAFHYCLD
eukprot:COSAG02_NODE_161_length_32629_cov_10.363142_2_plen_88_part_00